MQQLRKVALTCVLTNRRFLLSLFIISSRSYTKMTTTNGLIAVMQISSSNDKQKTFEICSGLIRQAKSRGAVMVFLPENTDYIATSKEETFTLAERFDFSEVPRGDSVLGKYRLLSKELKIWISIGSLHRLTDEPTDSTQQKLWNSHVLVDDEGRIAATYEKLHLFDVEIDRRGSSDVKATNDRARTSEISTSRISADESRVIHRGSRLIEPISTPVGSVGLAVCYDLRFPELAAWLRARGAHVLTYPSAFTYITGVAHWEALLRARAIETQSYVVAAAQTGQHSATRRSYGHAMVVDAFGCVLAQVREGAVGCCYAEVDLADLHRIRSQMPVAAHRRVDIFGPAGGAQPAINSVLLDSPTQLSAVLQSEATANALLTASSDKPFSVDRHFGPHLISANYIFYESSLSFAFVNLRPIVAGHVLVVPKRHVARAVDLLDAEATDLFRAALHVQRVIEQHHGASASNVAMQDGPAAGQSVPHVHFHIIPRKMGDFKRSDDVHEALENWEKIRTNRSDQEMTEEAAVYRKLFA